MTNLNHKGFLESCWYRKSMNNGVTLNFHARAPVRYKKSVVRSFVNRIYNSSSNWSHFHEGLSKAKEILHDNQYPTMFYEPVIHDVLEKIILKKQGLEKKSFDSDVTGKNCSIHIKAVENWSTD